jgi:hypothetical protein
VKTAKRVSELVRVITELRKGDALSPVLFNLMLKKVVRESNVTGSFLLGQIIVGLLAYADDTPITEKN